MCTFLPRGLPLNNFFRNEMSILETSGPFYPGYGLRRGHVEGVLLGLVLFFVLMREPPVAGGGGPAGLAAFYLQLRAVPLGRGRGGTLVWSLRVLASAAFRVAVLTLSWSLSLRQKC